MSLFRKCLLLLAIVIVFQIGLSIGLVGLHNQVSANTSQLERSFEFARQASRIMVVFLRIRELVTETSIMSPDLDPLIIQACSMVESLNNQQLLEHPERESAIRQINSEVSECRAILRRGRAVKPTMGNHINRQAIFWKPIRQAIANLVSHASWILNAEHEERETMRLLSARQHQDYVITVTLLCLGIAAEGVVVGLAIFSFNNSIKPRLTTVVRNTRRIAHQQELLSPVPGSDEISKLDEILHRFAGTVFDARRKEEDLINNQRDMIFSMNDGLLIDDVNKAFCSSTGFTAAQLQGQSISRLLHPDNVADTLKRFSSAKRKPRPEFETRIVREHGPTLDVLCSVNWSTGDGSFFCVMRDVSVQKKAERLRQEVVQMVSHDVRSPLTTVSGTLELLQTFGKLSSEGSALVDEGIAAADQVSALIDDFLQMEKIKAGMLELQVERGPLQPLLEQAHQSVSDMLELDSSAIEVVPSSASVLADRHELLGVVTTLLGTAARELQQNQRITVRTAEFEDFVEISFLSSASSAMPLPKAGGAPADLKSQESPLRMRLCKAVIALHRGSLIEHTAPFGFVLKMPTSTALERSIT